MTSFLGHSQTPPASPWGINIGGGLNSTAVVLECAAPDPAEVTEMLRRMGYRFTVESTDGPVIEIDDVIPVEVRFVDASVAGDSRAGLATLERLLHAEWREGFLRFVKERELKVRSESETWQPDAGLSKRLAYDPL